MFPCRGLLEDDDGTLTRGGPGGSNFAETLGRPPPPINMIEGEGERGRAFPVYRLPGTELGEGGVVLPVVGVLSPRRFG